MMWSVHRPAFYYLFAVHVASIRQTATIIQMTKEVLRTGDRDLVTFRFIRNPEYIRVGSRMVFREGRTKAVGTVIKVYPHMPAGATKQNRSKHAKQKGCCLMLRLRCCCFASHGSFEEFSRARPQFVVHFSYANETGSSYFERGVVAALYFFSFGAE